MARVATLLPDAKFVRPVVVAKGDAFDYFAQGGTVESLSVLLQEPEPKVAARGNDAIQVVMPVIAGTVTFDFTGLVAGPRTLDCEMRVTVAAVGSRRIPYSTRLNLRSANAIEGQVRTLKGLFPDKGLDWLFLVHDASSRADETWRGIDRSKSADEIDLIPVREWLVDGYVPLHTVTIPFGMGGSMKSLLAPLSFALNGCSPSRRFQP